MTYSSYSPYSPTSVTWPRRVVEWLFILLAVAALPFYYSSSLQRVFGGAQGVVSALARYRDGILHHWPQFSGFPLFGHRLFSIQVSPGFIPTWWPVVTLIAGAVLQIVIARFVPNQRLRDLARENWVILTTYLTLALIVSTVLNWNFLLMFILSVVVVFVYAGAYQLITHLWDGIRNTIRHVFRLAGIFFKNVAVIGTYIGEIFSDIIAFVRTLLDFIIAPFTYVHRRLTRLEDELEAGVDQTLSQLAAGPSQSNRQVPLRACLVVIGYVAFFGIMVLAALLVLRR